MKYQNSKYLLETDVTSTADQYYSQETAQALKLWVVLARCSSAVHELARKSAARFGVSASEFGVLEALYHLGALPLSAIAHKVLLSGGSITYTVDKLEARGLVRRKHSKQDRRVILADLTNRGKDLMVQHFPKHAQEISNAMAVLSQDEQSAATDMLKRLGCSTAGIA